MFMKWFAVMAALPMAALSLAGPAGAAPLAAVRAGEMQLRVLAAGHFDLAYRGVPLIRDGSFYLADDRWTTVYPVAGVHTLRPVVKEAPESAEVRLVSAENPLCMATQEFSVTGDSLSYALEYEVKPGTAARYAVCDLFLNKDVLAGAAYRGEAGAKPAAGTLDVAKTGHVLPGLATATFTTIVGEVTLTAASVPVGEDAGPGTPWVLRNVSDRPWGAEELRTFSALNQAELAEGAGIRQRLTFSLQVKPAADLDARLAAAVMARGLRALLGAAEAAAAVAGLPAEPAARAGALQKELDAACRSWQGARAAAQERKPFIIPEPQEMRLGRGGFALPAGLVLSVASNLSSREGTGIATLVEELQERFGVRAQVRPAGKAPARGAILIGEPSRNPLVAAWLKKAGIAVTPQSPGPEGYVLHVTPDTVVVAGSDAAGTFYGIQSLIQLLRRDARGKVTLPEVAIRDWPAMKWRGIHIWGLGGSATADDLRRVVRRVAARYKLNTVMFGNSYRAFRWKSHPEITPPGRGMPIEELAGIAQYARDHFQEFVPAFQSLGHVEDLVALHPEIAEAPATERAHSNAYCPSNPDTYRLLFDLWTEVINAVHPRYFHAGHDEVSHIGVCDRCKATPHADLYAGDVAKLHDWLKAHGAEMIIWGDMLLSQEEWRPKGVDAANGTTSAANPRGTDAAVGLLPKDVIIADWHYNAAAEFPTLAHFAGKGLRVLGCPWYGDRNNHNLALAARKAGVLGTVVTDWGFLVVNSAAACSVLGPAYAWSPGRPALDALPYDPPRVLAEGLRSRRPSDALGALFTPVEIAAQANRAISCADWSDRQALFGEGPGSDLWMVRGGRCTLEGMEFLIPAEADGRGRCLLLGVGGPGVPAGVEGIPVGRRAASLVILTALRVASPSVWTGAVARMALHYVDGTTEAFEMKEGLHVTDWRTYAPRENPWNWREGNADLYGAKPALRGFTRFGEDVNLQAVEWVNPHPEREIASLDLKVVRKDKGLFLAVLGMTAVAAGPAGSR